MHVSFAATVWRASPVFSLINGYRGSEWAICLTLSSKQQYLSQGIFPTCQPPLLALAFDISAKLFSPVAAKDKIIHCLLACSLARFLPYFHFPISVSRSNEATDRQMGQWASTVFPRPKANWGRLGKDLVLLNGPDMMGKSMCASNVFAWSERPAPNVLSAGNH